MALRDWVVVVGLRLFGARVVVRGVGGRGDAPPEVGQSDARGLPRGHLIPTAGPLFLPDPPFPAPCPVFSLFVLVVGYCAFCATGRVHFARLYFLQFFLWVTVISPQLPGLG